MSLKATVENIVASVRQGVPLRSMNSLLDIKVEAMFNSPRKILFIEIREALLFEFGRIVESKESTLGQLSRSEQSTLFKEDMVCILNYKEYFEERRTNYINDAMCEHEMIDPFSYGKTGLMFRTQEKDLFFQIISELIHSEQ